MGSIRNACALAILGLVAGCAAPRQAASPGPAPRAAPEAAPPALPAHGGPVEPAPAPPAPPRALARATLAAVGDVLMHEAVKRSAEAHRSDSPDGGYSWLYAPIADLLSQPDLTFANLETPIAPGSTSGTREYVFNAPPEALAALRRAGVDLVSVANNHAFDQGRPGFEETLRRVEAAGLRAVGAGASDRPAGPVRVEAGGLAIAFLGWAHFFNQGGNECPSPAPGAPPCLQAALLDRARAVEAVRAAAAQADAVVVSLHWGNEYEAQPRAEDVELAHQLADAGALVILGHHPHVLQPVELYRRSDGATAVIAYSLGNFVSNQSRKYVHGVTPEKVAATRDGALLRITLARRDYGRGVVRTEVDGADYLPLWTENDTPEIDRKKEPNRRPAIRVVAIDRALADVRAELARVPDPVPPDARERYVALRRREALLSSRRAAIAGVMGEELLRTDITTGGPSAVPASLPPDPPARSGAASSGCPCARPCPAATPGAAP
jgi:poly-gamma-glutamate capsule biosynthesis protein CapA/YwtB (metallophosphatase superfamily)